jgi:hypothetical protein
LQGYYDFFPVDLDLAANMPGLDDLDDEQDDDEAKFSRLQYRLKAWRPHWKVW